MDGHDEVFYTEGSQELKECRMKMLQYSIQRASYRLSESKPQPDVQQIANDVGPYKVTLSQFADNRCVSRGCLSPDETLFATSGWSGDCKVWGVPDCQLRTELKGHSDRVVNIRFHPMTGKIAADGPNIATASADKTVRLWSLNPEYEFQKCLTLEAHEDTVNSVEFHPMGLHIASGSHDRTWRLWDIETKKELLT